MTFALIALYVVSGIVAALAAYYVARSLTADLVLLGGCALMTVSWVAMGLVSLAVEMGAGGPTEAVTYWGYILTGVMLPVGGSYAALIERTKWGSLAIAAVAVTSAVLAYRLPQIWAGGFA